MDEPVIERSISRTARTSTVDQGSILPTNGPGMAAIETVSPELEGRVEEGP